MMGLGQEHCMPATAAVEAAGGKNEFPSPEVLQQSWHPNLSPAGDSKSSLHTSPAAPWEFVWRTLKREVGQLTENFYWPSH